MPETTEGTVTTAEALAKLLELLAAYARELTAAKVHIPLELPEHLVAIQAHWAEWLNRADHKGRYPFHSFSEWHGWLVQPTHEPFRGMTP